MSALVSLEREEKAEASAAGVRKMVGMANTSAPNCSLPIPSSTTYARGDNRPNSPSHFRDLIGARSGDYAGVPRPVYPMSIFVRKYGAPTATPRNNSSPESGGQR